MAVVLPKFDLSLTTVHVNVGPKVYSLLKELHCKDHLSIEYRIRVAILEYLGVSEFGLGRVHHLMDGRLWDVTYVKNGIFSVLFNENKSSELVFFDEKGEKYDKTATFEHIQNVFESYEKCRKLVSNLEVDDLEEINYYLFKCLFPDDSVEEVEE